MSSDSSDAFCYFFQWQLFFMHTWLSRNCVIISQKWGIHMNDGSRSKRLGAPNVTRLFPPQEPGYKAARGT